MVTRLMNSLSAFRAKNCSMNDADLKAVFAYLQSIPAVHNKVPSPIDPPEETKTEAKR